MRQKKIIANWKLNADYISMEKFANNISDINGIELLVAPSCINLIPAINLFRKKNIEIISQNVNLATIGNHTGSTSWIELKDYGIKSTIVGHPEATKDFQESENIVNKKIKMLLENNMKVILCVDESKLNIVTDSSKESIKLKIRKHLQYINKNYFAKNLMIVYKPSFINEKNVIPSAEFIINTIKFIRIFLRDEYGYYIGNNIPILYGGEFLSSQTDEIIKSEHLDGLFIDDEKAISPQYINVLIKYLYKYSTEEYAKYYENNILISEPLETDRDLSKEITLSFDEYEIDNDVHFKDVNLIDEEI